MTMDSPVNPGRSLALVGISGIATFLNMAALALILYWIVDPLDVGSESVAPQDILVPFWLSLIVLGVGNGVILLLRRSTRLVGVGALLGAAAYSAVLVVLMLRLAATVD